MKKIILAAVAALGLASAASAATYSVDVTANPFRSPGAPGLQTRAFVLKPSGPQNFNGSTIGFDLTNIGDSYIIDLFGLVHFDAPLGKDDTIKSPSTVTLNMGNLGTGVIAGVTYGEGDIGSPKGYAVADYQNTVRFLVGNGLQVRASIADITFGSDANGMFVNNRPGFGKVTATFTLAAVPVPAGGLLLIGALGGLAALRRRKAAALI